MNEPFHLSQLARSIFAETLTSVDAGRAVRQAVRLNGSQLTVVDTKFDLQVRSQPVYAIAFGKAAGAMATALDTVLGAKLTGGVLSTSPLNVSLPARWRTFAGGHPLPNEASLQAARCAFELLRQADETEGLVIFLVSGGGSAMLEELRDERISLEDLREMNRVLVTCGATIAEVNAVRRAVSAVKGGGLRKRAPRAAQITLIISDTNPGEAATVASGPTLAPPQDEFDPRSVIERYHLTVHLPTAVLLTINDQQPRQATQPLLAPERTALRQHHVLLDNQKAVTSAARAAERRGCDVVVVPDLVEQSIEEGCGQLVRQAFEWQARVPPSRVACLVSGGEFKCAVKGSGIGGRNAETALRCAIQMHSENARQKIEQSTMAVLSAGTDGIDGNSPAAGALSTNTTLSRAQAINLDAKQFLDASDAYTFFHALGDDIVTGPTGTNVRDLRLTLVSS